MCWTDTTELQYERGNKKRTHTHQYNVAMLQCNIWIEFLKYATVLVSYTLDQTCCGGGIFKFELFIKIIMGTTGTTHFILCVYGRW